MPINSYKELEVWKKSVGLVKSVYGLTREYPAFERFALSSQTQRAAVSIPANNAEGWGRGTRKEYLQFLKIAHGSLLELETHLIIANELVYLSEADFITTEAEISSIGKMLHRLISKLTNG